MKPSRRSRQHLESSTSSTSEEVQRKRLKPMISSLLNSTEGKERSKNTNQRPDDDLSRRSLRPSESTPILWSSQRSYDRALSATSGRPHNISVARDSRSAKALFDGEYSDGHCDEPHSAREGEALNRWEGGSMGEWFDEEALYANVATAEDSAEEVGNSDEEAQAQHSRSSYDCYTRNHRTYDVPRPRYYGEQEEPEPSLRRRASTVSAGSSANAVPPSPLREGCSSASEASRSRTNSVYGSPSPAPELSPAVAGEVEEFFSLDYNHGVRQPSGRHVHENDQAEEVRSRLSHTNVDSYATEIRPFLQQPPSPDQHVGDEQSPNTDAASPSIPPRVLKLEPDFVRQLPDPQLPSPSAPPPARAEKPKTKIGPRKGGNTEYMCQIRGCGKTVKMDERETRSHFEVCHREQFFHEKVKNNRRMHCAWPGCEYGTSRKDGILWTTYPRHILTVHANNPGRFFCPNCNAHSYTRMDALRRHMASACMRCKRCNTSFKSYPEFIEHDGLITAGWDCLTGPPKFVNAHPGKLPPSGKGNAKVRELAKETREKSQKGKGKGKGKGKETPKAVVKNECESEFESDSESVVNLDPHNEEDEELEYVDELEEEERDD